MPNNWMTRLAHSVMPRRRASKEGSLDPRFVARRFGRGNIYIQTGRVMFADEYAAMRKDVLEYDFR